jgi:LuxR family maltose regulon positive regulatory protein
MPLVEAKLHPPVSPPGTIDRQRLVDLLMSEPGLPIVTMVAAPGYGKTTVLAQWAARERRPVVWLTLDDLDNDPAVLLSYLSVAFDRVEPIDGSIRSAIAAPRQRIFATAVPRLTSELYKWARPAVVVLDDAHRLIDQTCLDTVAAIIDHLPAGFRVALAGRIEPHLPLARFRVQGRLLEIDQRLLALDEEETSALVAATGHVLDAAGVRELTTRTEGWAAGIHLASVAGATQAAGSFGSVTGRDGYIAGYLRSEFADSLADEDVTLLTRTAILDTVAPGIAEAVTGLSDASARLRSLAHANLLINEVEGLGAHYRYHNLLRDFLASELEKREPGVTPVIHAQASSWYAAVGDVDRAFAHAMAGGDLDTAARIVTAAALPTFYGGHGRTLERWLQGFGTEMYMRYPPLAVIAAWMHLHSGRADEADRMADIAERSAYTGPPGLGGASYASELAMLQAVMARHGPQAVLANAELALSQEWAGSPWRAHALLTLGAAHLLLGDPDAADVAFADCVAAGASAPATAMVALAKRASIAIARGDWKAAERHSRLARADLETEYFGEIINALLVYAVGARVAIHGGDVAGARADLVRAQIVRPLATHVAPWFAVDAHLELARAYLAASDPSGARIVLREAEQIVTRRPALGRLTVELHDLRRQLAGASSTLLGSSSLTGAELRLLPYLATYLSFEEIGERLAITRSTVKTEAMAIYGKLQTTSRGEAVERAIDLGLLEPFHGLMPPQPRTSD